MTKKQQGKRQSMSYTKERDTKHDQDTKMKETDPNQDIRCK